MHEALNIDKKNNWLYSLPVICETNFLSLVSPRQYLSNTNENVTVHISQIFLESSPKNQKLFKLPRHIESFQHMHVVLNIDENKINCIVCL